MKIVVGLVLFVLGIYDFIKKEVPVWLLIILGIACVVARVMTGMDTVEVLSGITVGAVILGICFLSKEKIGYGDGIVVLLIGIFLGGIETVRLAFYASLIMSAISMVLLVSKKGKMETTMAFIPAIFMGYLLI